MDYLTTGALLRERGVAYIALGSFFISLAWHLLRNADKAHTFLVTIRFCKSPWLSDILVFLAVTVCLIPGTRLVGTGGSLTTQGWNTLGKHDQKVALLAAFAGEWTINDALRKSPPLCVPSNDPNFGKTHCLYPRFRTTVSRQILTSALFRSEERLDGRLLGVLLRYELAIESFNEWISWIDQQLTRMNVHSPERLAKYGFVRKSPLVAQFMAIHSQIGEHLSAHYPELLVAASKDLPLVSDYAPTESQLPMEGGSETGTWGFSP